MVDNNGERRIFFSFAHTVERTLLLCNIFRLHASSCIVFVRPQVPSGRVAGGLPGEEHQQPGDQLLFAERPDHLDSVPDPGGCLHRSRPGRLQQPCHRVHSAGRWVQTGKTTDWLFFFCSFFWSFVFKFLIPPGTSQTSAEKRSDMVLKLKDSSQIKVFFLSRDILVGFPLSLLITYQQTKKI